MDSEKSKKDVANEKKEKNTKFAFVIVHPEIFEFKKIPYGLKSDIIVNK